MKKISTLFKKDPTNLGRVINEVDPDNEWALYLPAIATQKYDGTACAIINGELHKRYDAKHGKTAPEGAIPCQDADPITGHHPHWIKCDVNNPADRWALEAFGLSLNSRIGKRNEPIDATYELCGPKIGGNPENLPAHYLIKHGTGVLVGFERTFDGIRDVLINPDVNIEGIVFHHPDGRMCKIRKSDFGVNRAKPAPVSL